jgi:polar amino acid transport system substrate-binding protein
MKSFFNFFLQGVCLMASAFSCQAQGQSAQVLAPTGTLRASINVGNPLLAYIHPQTGQAAGLSVDLSQALATRLGIPLELKVFNAAGKSVQALSEGQADIGFFALDPLRGEGVLFTQAYVLIEGSYLVRQGSTIQNNAQVDQPGVRVMVGKGSAYDLYLTRHLKNAEILRAPTSPQVVAEFLSQGVEVAAGVRQQLEADARAQAGLQLIPGRFMVIEQAMAVPKSRGPEAAAQLDAFVDEMKRSGMVAKSLLAHQVQGASIAP